MSGPAVGEQFSVKKFLSGFNLLDKVKAAKMAYISVLITIGGLILWRAFIKPTNEQVTTLEQRLQFHGARIETLTITTEQTAPPAPPAPKQRRWAVGIFAQSGKDTRDPVYGAGIWYLF